MSKAYVLLSGVIDSSTCLAEACRLYGHEHVTALSIRYGQTHQETELDAARKIINNFGCLWLVKNITNIIGVGGLTDPNLEIPQVSYEELPEGISPTYVPFRNGLMLSILASIAMGDKEAQALYYGAHVEDAERDAYPDCSVPFIHAMQTAINIGTYGQVVLYAPLMFLTKAQVISKGEELQVPWELTWSCYKGGDIHCGTCPTCIARRQAFIGANIKDNTEYAA